MSKAQITLAFGLILVASGFAAVQTAEWRASRKPPAPEPGQLCPELALRASPARLITRAQTGAASMLGCKPLDAAPGGR